ncbi:MAG: sigma-70 family RNA polymerase sigma factor [Anaerolineales bacterium]|nr:sigma-70 family RNA polymerase sigma factor [Anaerolineales bacterium]
MDEHALARRAARGDRDAFGELVRCCQTGVFNVAWRMLGDRQEAEDAAQETFLRAYRLLAGYDPQRPPAPWLKKIAVNVCLNRLEARRPLMNLDEEVLEGQDNQPALSPPVSPDPEAEVVSRERSRQIASAILSLPPRFQAAIELRHFQELSYAEMAEVLARPLSDVKSDLFRARRLLAEKLKELPPQRP